MSCIKKFSFWFLLACNAVSIISSCSHSIKERPSETTIIGKWNPSWENHYRGRIDPEPFQYRPKTCFNRSFYFPEDRPSNTSAGVPMVHVVIQHCRADKHFPSRSKATIESLNEYSESQASK